MDWKQLLADIIGSVDQELLRRNEYRIMQDRILRNPRDKKWQERKD